MDRVFKEEVHGTWYYIDNKGRKRGWYCSEYAAKVGLENYIAEEEENENELK